MLKRIYRLTKGYEFQKVRQSGKSWAHPLLVLVATPNNLGITRCGFSAGKRMGKAHVRNYYKRALSEAVRVRHAGLKKGYDLVWIARQNMTEQTNFWEIDAAVETLLKRAKLIESTAPQLEQRPKPQPDKVESSEKENEK